MRGATRIKRFLARHCEEMTTAPAAPATHVSVRGARASSSQLWPQVAPPSYRLPLSSMEAPPTSNVEVVGGGIGYA